MRKRPERQGRGAMVGQEPRAQIRIKQIQNSDPHWLRAFFSPRRYGAAFGPGFAMREQCGGRKKVVAFTVRIRVSPN